MKTDETLGNSRLHPLNEDLECRPARPSPCGVLHQIVVLAIGEHTIGVPRSALVWAGQVAFLTTNNEGPTWLLGIAVVGHDWVPVISIQDWLQGTASVLASPAQVALLECDAGCRLAMLIDNVIGYRDVFQEELAELEHPLPYSTACPVRAVTRDMLQLIDIRRILAQPALAPEAMSNYFLSTQRSLSR